MNPDIVLEFFWCKINSLRTIFKGAVTFITRPFMIQSLFCKRILFDSDLLFPQETNLHNFNFLVLFQYERVWNTEQYKLKYI